MATCTRLLSRSSRASQRARYTHTHVYMCMYICVFNIYIYIYIYKILDGDVHASTVALEQSISAEEVHTYV